MKYLIFIFVLLPALLSAQTYESYMTREFPSYSGVIDTVTVIWSTATIMNDSALLDHGYTETDGGWINYFDNPDKPQARGSIQIHFLQTEDLQGDANDDGVVNIGDAVFIINYVFPGMGVGIR